MIVSARVNYLFIPKLESPFTFSESFFQVLHGSSLQIQPSKHVYQLPPPRILAAAAAGDGSSSNRCVKKDQS